MNSCPNSHDILSENSCETVKTPVSLLQEICMGMKLGFPRFQLERVIQDETYGQTFEMSVVVGSLGLEASGIARNKMLAKHKAANNLLEKIQEAGESGLELNTVRNEIVLQCCERIKSSTTSKKDSSLEFNMSSNKLKQYCMSQELTPVYKVIEVTGPAHERKFVMSCQVKDYTTEGEGNSKKVAKTIAAEKMLLLLEA